MPADTSTTYKRRALSRRRFVRYLAAEDTGPVAIWPTEPQSHFGDQPGVLNTKLRMKYASGDEIRFELDRGTGPDVGAIFVCEDAQNERSIDDDNTMIDPPRRKGYELPKVG